MKPLRAQLEEQYAEVAKWATFKYGTNGSDFVHDAIVRLLEAEPVPRLTDLRFVGLWQVYIRQAYGQYRKSQGENCQHSPDSEYVEQHALLQDDTAKIIRKLLRRDILPYVPYRHRELIQRLFIQGYTLQVYAKSKQLSIKHARTLREQALEAMGNIVVQDNLRLTRDTL